MPKQENEDPYVIREGRGPPRQRHDMCRWSVPLELCHLDLALTPHLLQEKQTK